MWPSVISREKWRPILNVCWRVVTAEISSLSSNRVILKRRYNEITRVNQSLKPIGLQSLLIFVLGSQFVCSCSVSEESTEESKE